MLRDGGVERLRANVNSVGAILAAYPDLASRFFSTCSKRPGAGLVVLPYRQLGGRVSGRAARRPPGTPGRAIRDTVYRDHHRRRSRSPHRLKNVEQHHFALGDGRLLG